MTISNWLPVLNLQSFFDRDDIGPPRFLFLDTNQHCNLKCQHCFYWTREEVQLPGHISVERRSEIIDEFAELNPQGTVVICGGESMLNPERFYPITKQARRLGLNCFAVVNGTKITTVAEAERAVAEGPSEITISLNSHRAEVHDRTRGMRGAFDLAVGALRLLLAARRKLGRTTPVYAMAVVCEQNYRELDDFFQFVLHDIGADKLKLNFLQPSFGPVEGMTQDKFFARNVVADYEELDRVLRRCDLKYGLNLNPEWLRVVKLYHRSVADDADASRGWSGAGTAEPICNSYERNIMVNMFGEAKLCFSTQFPGAKLREYGDLRSFWYGNRKLRQEMAKCTAYCGISHSVRRESATQRHGEVRKVA